MLFIARLYSTQQQAEAAVSEYVEIGYASDTIAMLTSAAASVSPEGEAAPSDGNDDREMAVRAGQFMGMHSDFYLSRVKDGNCLVVAAPPFIASGKAESILNSHDPLPDSHLPPTKKFVPISEQATPFSDWLGLPALTSSDTPFSNVLGFGFKQEGLSHFSRMFKPLSDGTVFPMKTKASKDTVFPMSTKSQRLEGKGSSFGMGFSTKRGTPFSSTLGLPLLTKKKFFLS